MARIAGVDIPRDKRVVVLLLTFMVLVTLQLKSFSKRWRI